MYSNLVCTPSSTLHSTSISASTLLQLCSPAPSSCLPYAAYVSGTAAKVRSGNYIERFVRAKKYSSVVLQTQTLVKSSGGKIQVFGYDVMVFPLYRQLKKMHALCPIKSEFVYYIAEYFRTQFYKTKFYGIKFR